MNQTIRPALLHAQALLYNSTTALVVLKPTSIIQSNRMVRILAMILGCLKRKSDSGALLTRSLARICLHSSKELAQVSFGRGVAGGGHGRGWSVLFVEAIKFSLLVGCSLPSEMLCILSQFSFICTERYIAL